jgi:hypothetical protein
VDCSGPMMMMKCFGKMGVSLKYLLILYLFHSYFVGRSFHLYVVELPLRRTNCFGSVLLMRTAREWNSLPAGHHCWGTGRPYGLQVRRTGHNPLREHSADWWVLMTANVAGTNG